MVTDSFTKILHFLSLFGRKTGTFQVVANHDIVDIVSYVGYFFCHVQGLNLDPKWCHFCRAFGPKVAQ